MKSERLRSAAALVLSSALLFATAPLAATTAGETGEPPIATTPTGDTGGGEDPVSETDLGPMTDPDGLGTGAPTPSGDAPSFLSWLQSLLGGILRGI